MAHMHKSDAEYVATTHNMARFFTEHRQVALVLLLATFVWGFFGYQQHAQAQGPGHPGASGLGPVPVAGSDRGAGRATGYASHRASHRSELHAEAAEPIGLRNPLAQLPWTCPLSTSSSMTT